MKEFKRIISLAMVLILCVGLLPVNQNLLKAEAKLDDSTKLKNIILRVYDGKEWTNAKYTPEFDPNKREYTINLDIKYKKVQFFFEKISDDQVIEAKDKNKCPVRDSNYTEEYSLRPQDNDFSFFVKASNGSKDREYFFKVVKGLEGNAHRVYANYGHRDLPFAFEGDIVQFKGNTAYQGKVFDKWIVEKSNLELDNPYRIMGEFIMPNSEVDIRAQFKESSDDGSKLRYIIVHAMKDNVWENFYDAVKIKENKYEYELNLSGGYTDFYLTLQTEDFTPYFENENNPEKGYLLRNSNDHIKIQANSSELKIADYYYGFRTEESTLNKEENVLNFKIISKNSQNTSKYTLKINNGEVKYTVTFNPNNNGLNETNTEEFKKGTEYTLPENNFTAPENKVFAGWKIGDEDKKPGDKITVNGNIDVKAIWKDIEYKVIFNNNEGSGDMPEKTVKKGTDFELPDCTFTAPDGQEFKAWSVEGQEYPAKAKIKINKETTIKAIWKDIEYKVTFNSNEGTGDMPEQKVKKGADFELPDCTFTAPDGQEFKAWSVEGQEYPAKTKIKINKETEVKAIWQAKTTEKFIVTINPNNNGKNESKTEEIKKGEDFELPDCTFIAPEGQEFKAWLVEGQEYQAKEKIKINKETEVKAIWKDIEYKVTFNSNGAEGTMQAQKIKKGEKFTLPENGFAPPENKKFAGWKIGNETKLAGDEITVNGNTEVTAIWKDIEYKVTFNPNEGSGDMAGKLVKAGEDFELPDCTFTAPKGQEFKAWSVDGQEYQAKAKIKINKETEVTAIWKDIEYKVTFDSNEGTGDMAGKLVKAGEDYELPDCAFIAPEGQEFKAWLVDGQEYPAKTKIKINKETTIKAIWQDKPIAPKPENENKKYEIKSTQASNGTIIINPTEAKEGELVTVQALPDYGYELESIIILDKNQKLVPMKANQFTMPKGAVSIYVKYRELAPAIYPEIDEEKPIENKRHRRDWYYKEHDEEKNPNEEVKSNAEKEIKDQETKTIITIGSQTLEKVMNGVRTVKNMDSAPYIKRGRTMLPLRYLAEALGYKVFWLNETKTVVIVDLGLRVEIPIDTNLIIVNGIKYTSDLKPEIVCHRTMLPIANIARALGLKDGEDILWDEVNRQVTINKK